MRRQQEGRLHLPASTVIRVSVIFFLAGALLSAGAPLYGQVVSGGHARFLGVQESDRVGPKSAYPDGKPDAAFSLALSENPDKPELEVTAIEITVTSGPAGRWSTAPRSPKEGFIGVASSRTPSVTLNPEGGPLKINPSREKDLLLIVNDDGHFSKKGRRYQVKVVHKDRSSWSIPVSPTPVDKEQGPSTQAGAYPVRMSAVLKGLSAYDAVGPDKTIKADNKGDGQFVLTVEAKNKEISAIQISNVDGTPSMWDTVPGTQNRPVGVALISEPTRLLNSRDGSIRIKVKDKVDLNLYVADNGSIEKEDTKYRVTVSFTDGGISWCPVTRVSQPPAGEAPVEVGVRPTVNFLPSWLGYVSTDAVGKYPEMKPDGAADAVFGLDIEVTPKSEITGIEIQSQTEPERKWATGKTSPGAWGLGVTHQNSPRVLQNRSDGSVRIPVDKREQFYLFAADPGNLSSPAQRLRVVVHLADGSSYQQFVRKPVGTTPTVAPQPVAEQPRARGLITCEFRGLFVDLVNTSNRPGKDGYSDGTFILKLRETDKTLTKVVIKGPDGAVRWSSQPKGSEMFLGVALYPKVYDLVSLKAGPLHIPVAGRKTIYLYAADNGLLSDPTSRLSVEVTFSDQSTLSADVIK